MTRIGANSRGDAHCAIRREMSCITHPASPGARRNPFSGSPCDGRSRRTAMTFHADAYVPEACPSSDSPATAFKRSDVCTIRLTPRHGGGVREVAVRYALYGAAGAPVVVVQGGISANRNAAAREDDAGWWEPVVGDDRAVDTRRFRVLSIEWIDRASIRRPDVRRPARDRQRRPGRCDRRALARARHPSPPRVRRRFVRRDGRPRVRGAASTAPAQARRDRRRAPCASARDRRAQPAARDRASLGSATATCAPASTSRAGSR